jgi:hypothetical protein
VQLVVPNLVAILVGLIAVLNVGWPYQKWVRFQKYALTPPKAGLGEGPTPPGSIRARPYFFALLFLPWRAPERRDERELGAHAAV